MDLEAKMFGRGPRELGGAVDLINYYKVWSHFDFFCKRSLPLTVSESHYLHNVVGDTDIRKGEGMELDQLLQNASHLRERNACIHPFDLDLLRDAFHMKETTPVNQPFTEKGIPTATAKLKSEFKDREKRHKKHKDKHNEKDRKKKIHRHKAKSSVKSRNAAHGFSLEDLEKQQEMKRRINGFGDLSAFGTSKKLVMELAKGAAILDEGPPDYAY